MIWIPVGVAALYVVVGIGVAIALKVTAPDYPQRVREFVVTAAFWPIWTFTRWS